MTERTSGPKRTALELVAALDSPDRDGAWRRFLERYAAQIHHIVGQSAGDADDRHDCFLYVCEKLCERRFRRLRGYRSEGSVNFRAWLGVVVANLCIDWQRARVGRPRPFRNILELDPLAQRVFHYRFQRRFPAADCLAALQSEFPGLREPQLAGAVSRVQATLTPRQQWLLSVDRTASESLDDATVPPPAAPGPNPEQAAASQQDLGRLDRALARLQPRQRQLLLMRYQQELSFKEIARLARLGDPFRARRQVQSALDELAALLED